jgi:predicted nuclease of predicted toxin-antitoxin system
LATASDAEILELGGKESSVVVTLDADSHAILALPGAAKPPVIRVRIVGLRSEQLAGLLAEVLEACMDDLLRIHGIRQ